MRTSPTARLDVSRMAALGWKARIALRDGIAQTYQDFRDRHATAVGT